MIFDHHTRIPTLPLLNELKYMTLKRVSYHKTVMMYKSKSGLTTLYVKDMFKCVKDVNN